METKKGAAKIADTSKGLETGAMDTGHDSDADIYAVFESLEQLREAQAREAAAKPPAKQADEGSLEAVLTHYKDWLNTLDRR